jgi:two-component system, chemotaxis family, protein-glutamate methylesterase/glutaminase
MKTNAPSSSNHPPDTDSGFAGTLKNIQLNDLIQMCCLSASSLCMRVTKDNRQGTIFIVDGEIVHAACEDMVGEEAFYRILGWQTGSFESIEVSTTPQRTIQKNYHFLIMEAARRVDEEALSDAPSHAHASGPAEDTQDDQRLRVLIVDDSPMMRKILSSILTTSNEVKVIGMAGNGKEAIAMIDDLSPDLVTLDVNMPVMDGTSTIKHIMIKKPCPVVIMSNPGDGSTKTIFNFLELGAVDFMSKPTKNQDILVQQQKILERIRIAATAKVGNFRIARIPKACSRVTADTGAKASRHLVIVVSGPGGHPEQMSLLSGLVPAMADIDGAVVALQSLPPTFIEAYAHYLSERCGCPVSPINGETQLCAGQCYVGVHGTHLRINENAHQPIIEFGDAENGGFPIDRILSTAAETFGARLTVVLLSGAGTGEQAGLRAVREKNGRIVLRQRASSLVAEPLDPVVAGGLADDEVRPADLVRTVLAGYDQKH